MCGNNPEAARDASSIDYVTEPCILFQSVVMLMFREEKSPEDEIKAWQFWHGRQHSVKQRILDAGKLTTSYYFSYCLMHVNREI